MSADFATEPTIIESLTSIYAGFASLYKSFGFELPFTLGMFLLCPTSYISYVADSLSRFDSEASLFKAPTPSIQKKKVVSPFA